MEERKDERIILTEDKEEVCGKVFKKGEKYNPKSPCHSCDEAINCSA